MGGRGCPQRPEALAAHRWCGTGQLQNPTALSSSREETYVERVGSFLFVGAWTPDTCRTKDSPNFFHWNHHRKSINNCQFFIANLILRTTTCLVYRADLRSSFLRSVLSPEAHPISGSVGFLFFKLQLTRIVFAGRTFPTHPYFSTQLGAGQLSLYNILKAYSLLDQEVGYCQGLSFVAGILLLHMGEEEAFNMLKFLMFEMGLRKQYRPDMIILQVESVPYVFARDKCQKCL